MVRGLVLIETSPSGAQRSQAVPEHSMCAEPAAEQSFASDQFKGNVGPESHPY